LRFSKAERGFLPMIQQPSTTAQLLEVFTLLQNMRESQPVAYDPATEIWHLFGYDEVEQMLNDSQHFSAAALPHAPHARHRLALDAPSHHLIRGVIKQALAPREVNQLAPYIHTTVQTLLNQYRSSGSIEMMHDLITPLVMSSLAELVGIPSEQREDLQRTISTLVVLPHSEQMGRAIADLSPFLLPLLEQRRRQPEFDLLSRLLTAEVDGMHLPEPEVISFCCLLLVMEYETMIHLLGNAIYCLASRPEVCARLRHVPAPIYSTIEEVLRFLPPVWIVERTTVSDVTLGAQRIPAHARISAWIVSANRDARYFVQPEQFDIDRIPNRHLSFGDSGMHFCVGVCLVRLLASITLTQLVHQCNDLALPPEHILETVKTPTAFGLKNLPLTFQPLPLS